MTKGELRTRVANAADALNSPRWDFSEGGEVDIQIGSTMDQEWRRVLDASPFYRVGRRTVTSDANGYYLLSALTTGMGDAVERLYKVIAVAVGDVVYEQSVLTNYIFASQQQRALPQWMWYFEGDKILAMPPTANAQARIVVNHIPVRFENLATEASTVIWPDGYENVLVWASAAKLLAKGAVESPAAAALEYQAESLRKDLLEDVIRRSLRQAQPVYADAAIEWGG